MREAIVSPTGSVRRFAQKIEVSSSTAWLVVPVHSAAESARHYALRGSTGCCLRTVGLSAISRGSSMKHTSTWMVTFANRLFLGLPVNVSRAAPTTIPYEQMRCVYFTGKIAWKIGMDATEMTVHVVCFAFTRTRRSKHITESSVYARTEKKTAFPYLKPLCSSRIYRLSLFLLPNTHQPFYVLCHILWR